MAFNNTALTAEDVKLHFIRRTKDQSIVDNDVIDSLNDFYSIMKRAERQAKRIRSREYSAVAVSAAGYTLTGLSSIGSDNVKVYKGSALADVSPSNLLPERLFDSQEAGWCILGDGKLYITPFGQSESVVIFYDAATPRVAVGSKLSAHVLLIDIDLEQTLRRYVRYTFYEGQYQDALAQENEQKFLEEMTRYFSMGSKAHFFNQT